MAVVLNRDKFDQVLGPLGCRSACRSATTHGVTVAVPDPCHLGCWVHELRFGWLVAAETLSEKREVTGSTPVPTTGKTQFRGHFDRQSVSSRRFRAHYVPIRNWNEFALGSAVRVSRYLPT